MTEDEKLIAEMANAIRGASCLTPTYPFHVFDPNQPEANILEWCKWAARQALAAYRLAALTRTKASEASAVITWAIENEEDHYDRLAFLKTWQEEGLDGLREEWPEFVATRTSRPASSSLDVVVSSEVREAVTR